MCDLGECMGQTGDHLYLLEVLVDKVNINTEKVFECSPNEPMPPVKVKIQFMDFEPLEIEQEEIPPCPEMEGAEGAGAQSSANASAGTHSSRATSDKVSVGSSVPPKTPTAGSLNHSTEKKMSSGKSCLFPMNPAELIENVRKGSLGVYVFGIPCDRPAFMIGQVRVALTEAFEEAITIATTPVALPVSSFLDETYTLTNLFCEPTGEISMYIRLSCFGSSVFAHFSKGGTGSQGYSFSNANKNKKIGGVQDGGKEVTTVDCQAKKNMPELGGRFLCPMVSAEENLTIQTQNKMDENPFRLPVPWKKSHDPPPPPYHPPEPRSSHSLSSSAPKLSENSGWRGGGGGGTGAGLSGGGGGNAPQMGKVCCTCPQPPQVLQGPPPPPQPSVACECADILASLRGGQDFSCPPPPCPPPPCPPPPCVPCCCCPPPQQQAQEKTKQECPLAALLNESIGASKQNAASAKEKCIPDCPRKDCPFKDGFDKKQDSSVQETKPEQPVPKTVSQPKPTASKTESNKAEPNNPSKVAISLNSDKNETPTENEKRAVTPDQSAMNRPQSITPKHSKTEVAEKRATEKENKKPPKEIKEDAPKSSPKKMSAEKYQKILKNIYEYTAGMYPGNVIGHKDCIPEIIYVPKHMGWLWNRADRVGFKPEETIGWRPGAITKAIMEIMRNLKKGVLGTPWKASKPTKEKAAPKAAAKGKGKAASVKGARSVTAEQQQQQPTRSPPPTRGPRQAPQKATSATEEEPAARGEVGSGEPADVPIQPTLHIHKKDGFCYISMYPMSKTGGEVQPVQFKIDTKRGRTEEDGSSGGEGSDDSDETSSDESLEIEFVSPAALELAKKMQIRTMDEAVQCEPTDAGKSNEGRAGGAKGKKK